MNKAMFILGSVFAFFLICHPNIAFAASVLTQDPITGIGSGVTSGTFIGGGTGLNDKSDLAPPYTGQRNYIAQKFVPSKLGSYVFGISRSPNDTSIILYNKPFNPLTPDDGAVEVDDDDGGSSTPAGVPVMGGANVCSGSAGLCPRITRTLQANHTYYIVITSYYDDGGARGAQPINFPQNFYVWGEPVIIGSKKLDTAKAALSNTLKIDNRQLLTNLMRTDDASTLDAVNRHVASREQGFSSNNVKKPLIKFSSSGMNKTLNVASSLGSVHDVGNRKQMIITSDFNYVSRDVKGNSSNANFRLGLEKFQSMRSTVGAFFGMSINQSDFVFPYAGNSLFVGGTLGVYGVTTLLNNLQIASNMTAGLSGGEVELNSGLEKWKSEFNTELLSVGLLSTGNLSLQEMSGSGAIKNLEIWPLISVQYGTAKSNSLISNFTFEGIFQNLIVDAVDLKVTNLKISPQVKFDLSSYRSVLSADRITIAPKYMCRSVETDTKTNSCGAGMDIDLSKKNNGLKTFGFRWEKIADEKIGSITINLRL